MEFTKKKTVLPEGQVEWVYTQTPHTDERPFPPLQIIATRLGMRFEGRSCTITDMKDLQDFAKVISDAWVDHDKLLKSAVGGVQITTEMPK